MASKRPDVVLGIIVVVYCGPVKAQGVTQHLSRHFIRVQSRWVFDFRVSLSCWIVVTWRLQTDGWLIDSCQICVSVENTERGEIISSWSCYHDLSSWHFLTKGYDLRSSDILRCKELQSTVFQWAIVVKISTETPRLRHKCHSFHSSHSSVFFTVAFEQKFGAPCGPGGPPPQGQGCFPTWSRGL